MARLGIKSTSSPFDYTKLIAPMEKQVEEYDKATDAISLTAGSLDSLNPYLENLKDSDNRYIKDYFAIQEEANTLADLAANKQISKNELLSRSRKLNQRVKGVVPVLENAIRAYTQARSTQSTNESKGLITVGGANDITQFIGGNAPETRYINPEDIIKFGYTHGVSAAKASGQKTHFDKAKTRTINGVNYTILPTETGIEATESNVRGLMTPELESQVRAQFNIPANVIITPYLQAGIMSGLNASYSKGESVQHYQSKNGDKDNMSGTPHNTHYYYRLPTDDYAYKYKEEDKDKLNNTKGTMVRVRAVGDKYYAIVNMPKRDKEGKVVMKDGKIETYEHSFPLDSKANISQLVSVKTIKGENNNPDKKVLAYLNGEMQDILGEDPKEGDDFTGYNPTLGAVYKAKRSTNTGGVPLSPLFGNEKISETKIVPNNEDIWKN